MEIHPDKVKGLEHLLDLIDETQRRDYQSIMNYVQMYLSSRFEKRRKFALRSLKEMLNQSTEVHTLEGRGIIYACISLTPVSDAFLYIGKYDALRPVLEGMSGETEKRFW